MKAPIPLSAILVFTGLWLTSSVQADQTLVPAGATWKYLDNGSNQGTAWQAPFFSDALWAEGAAQLGYGDGDEATVVGFGGNTSNRFITTYFRKTFSVSNPAAFSGLNLSLLRDDGAVVYLNGQELFRDGIADGILPPARDLSGQNETHYDKAYPMTAAGSTWSASIPARPNRL